MASLTPFSHLKSFMRNMSLINGLQIVDRDVYVEGTRFGFFYSFEQDISIAEKSKLFALYQQHVCQAAIAHPGNFSDRLKDLSCHDMFQGEELASCSSDELGEVMENALKLHAIVEQQVFTLVNEQKKFEISHGGFNEFDDVERKLVELFHDVAVKYLEEGNLDLAGKAAKEIRHTVKGTKLLLTLINKYFVCGDTAKAVAMLHLVSASLFHSIDEYVIECDRLGCLDLLIDNLASVKKKLLVYKLVQAIVKKLLKENLREAAEHVIYLNLIPFFRPEFAHVLQMAVDFDKVKGETKTTQTFIKILEEYKRS